jgi:uncharacterized membrane protein
LASPALTLRGPPGKVAPTPSDGVRFPMRLILVIALLGLAFARSPAFGEGIPQDVLDNDYKLCMQDCASKNGKEERCKAFCSCMNEEMQAQFTYAEYQKLVTDLNAGQLADKASVDKLKANAATCSQQPAPTP